MSAHNDIYCELVGGEVLREGGGEGLEAGLVDACEEFV
jgi:hypothetical protein